MSIEKFPQVFAQPEQEPRPAVSFEEYRKNSDRVSGMQRVGVYDNESYINMISHPDTVFDHKGYPTYTANDCVDALDESVVTGRLVSVGFENDFLPGEGCIRPNKAYLSAYDTEQLMNAKLGEAYKLDSRTLINSDEVMVDGDGCPEYQVLSFYETGKDVSVENSRALELIDSGRFVTDKQTILDNIDELASIHVAAFTKQSQNMAYEGGLSPDTLKKVLQDPSVYGVAVQDESGDFASFGLFTSDYKTIEWLNPAFYEPLIETAKDNNIIVQIPYVVATKPELMGGALFNDIVEVSKHVALEDYIERNGHLPDGVMLSYESSTMSINYTPRVINRAMKQAGFAELGHHIETVYFTQPAVNS